MHLTEGVDRNARTAAPTLAVIISTLQVEAAPLTEPAFVTPTNATQADIIPVIAKIKKYLLKGTALLTIDAAAQLVGGVLIVKHCLSLDIGEFFLAMRTLVPCSKWSPVRPRHWPLVAERSGKVVIILAPTHWLHRRYIA
ncbi:hypothetical protein BJ138DRAFT_19228 [Hygrophoropsis aurantiaca]|uniref:Uncharacterized protein n=1 Tax=Hygrophoropsis aurantiaca TaxID=72124 RepID=A0ACB8AQX3_9AGAM|nr:hypothetical protein BJ138DRAFT_19228 [Hygrophoropsis aurantiaca]